MGLTISRVSQRIGQTLETAASSLLKWLEEPDFQINCRPAPQGPLRAPEDKADAAMRRLSDELQSVGQNWHSLMTRQKVDKRRAADLLEFSRRSLINGLVPARKARSVLLHRAALWTFLQDVDGTLREWDVLELKGYSRERSICTTAQILLFDSFNRPKNACAILKDTFGALPRDPDAATLLACALQRAGSSSEAIEVREHCCQLWPDVAQHRRWLAGQLLEMGLTSRGIKVLESAVGTAPRNDEEALCLTPLVGACRRSKKVAKARAYLREAMTEPLLPTSDLRPLACEAAILGEDAAHRALLERVVNHRPTDVQAWAELAQASATDNPERAAAAWERVIALQPADIRAYRALVELHLFALGDNAAAERYCRGALSLAANVADLHEQLAAIASLRGKPAEAAAALRRALELRPLHTPWWRRLAFLLQEVDAAQALIAFEQVVASDPQDVAAWHALATLAQQQPVTMDRALHAWTTLTELQPDLSEPWLQRGRLREQDKNRSGALADYEAAAARDEQSLQAWLGVGRMLAIQLHAERGAKLSHADAARFHSYVAYLRQAADADDATYAARRNELLGAEAPPLDQGRIHDVRHVVSRLRRACTKEIRRVAPPPQVAAPETEAAAPETVKPVGEPKPAPERLVGYSWEGKQVMESADGTQRWLDLAAPPAAAERIRAANSVKRRWRIRPSPTLRAALDASLRQPVCGAHTANEFITALSSHGDTLLVGGTVRDAIAADAAGAPQPRGGDVDLVTSACARDVNLTGRALAHDVRGNQGDGGITSSIQALFLGVVSFSRLDISSIRVAGMYEPKRALRDSSFFVWPVSFGVNLHADAEARDFCCNAVYYDPEQSLLLDPTGYGVDDAKAKLLRIPSDKYVLLNNTLAVRYLARRNQGYTPATAQTVEHVWRNAQQFFDGPQFAATLARLAPKACEHVDDLHRWLDQLAQTLQHDVQHSGPTASRPSPDEVAAVLRPLISQRERVAELYAVKHHALRRTSR